MKTEKEIEEMAERKAKIYADSEAFSDERWHFKQGFIKGYQAAQEEMKWIDCRDRMPNEEVIVLCYTAYHTTLLAHWDFSLHCWFFQDENDENSEITHWQPLPQKPLIH